MPGLSGIETMRGIRTVAPHVRFVVCSGHSEQQVRTDFGFAREAMTFVGKPYRRDVLVDAVARALDEQKRAVTS
jgi:FixJ family two-component response regulator